MFSHNQLVRPTTSWRLFFRHTFPQHIQSLLLYMCNICYYLNKLLYLICNLISHVLQTLIFQQRVSLSSEYPNNTWKIMYQCSLHIKMLYVYILHLTGWHCYEWRFANDMKTIFSFCEFQKIPPFMIFFWEEQQKYLQVKK